jgi:monoamine oxidase
MMNKSSEKIIIIGAGLSGLYTGHLLQKLGYEILILEARDRVGGRTLTIDSVDLGGTWISSKQPRIIKLCTELGLKIYRQFDEGASITYFNKNRIEEASSEDAVKFINEKKPFEQCIELFDEITQQDNFGVDPENLDRINLAEWNEKNISDETTRHLMNWSSYAAMCMAPEKTSAFFWLYFLKNSGGYKVLASTKEGAQEFRIEGGSQNISIKPAEKLNVIYNAPVTKIEKNNEGYQVYAAGKIYSVHKIISAMPIALIPSIDWGNSLEVERLEFYKKMHMGSITKLFVQYEKPFWRDKGYSGLISSDTPPIYICFDVCNTKYNALVLFLVGKEIFSDEVILEQLAFLLNDSTAKAPSKIYRKNWNEDPFSGGCYFCTPEPDTFAKNQSFLREPYNDIYFAGTETARHWMGYMEGALESAERVVGQIA